MKKRLILLFGVFAFVIFNVYVSNVFDAKTDITIQSLENMAKADSEGDDCWTNMKMSFGSEVLKCNDPCCYEQNKYGIGEAGGTCSGGPYEDC